MTDCSECGKKVEPKVNGTIDGKPACSACLTKLVQESMKTKKTQVREYPELKVWHSDDGKTVNVQFPRDYITSLRFWQDDFLRTMANRGLGLKQ